MAVDRLEFDKKTKLAMFKRAGGPDKTCCEGCGAKVVGRDFDYDHTVAEWILEDIQHGYRGPLAADDGKLLGKGKTCSCHKDKTSKEAGERGHVNRVLAKAAKAVKRKGAAMPGSKASGIRKRMSGKVEKW